MKLADWARQQGISYVTAWRWWKAGKLPLPAWQTSSGTILVQAGESDGAGTGNTNARAALYARVSGSDQTDDLDRQLGRLSAFAADQGLNVARTVKETGSGLNGHRKKLLSLLREPSIEAIVVEHRDRLARFGADYIEAALQANGRRVIVVDEAEMNDDLVQDMIDVMTSFCARLYGRRGAKNRAKRSVRAVTQEVGR